MLDQRNPEPSALSADERELVERMRRHWSPPPLAPAARSAFTAELVERVTARRSWLHAAPALAALALLAALWIGLGERAPARPAPSAAVIAAVDPSERWAREVFSGVAGRFEASGFEAPLPPDYQAIAYALDQE